MWTLFGFEATPPAQSGPATPTQAGPAPREVLDAAAACADFAAKLALLDEECRRSAAARRRAPLEAADAAWAAAAAALGEEDLVAASLAPFIAMDVDSDDEACGDAAAGDEAAELLPPAPDDCMMVDDAADADGGADDADREAFGSDSDGFEKVPGLDVGALAALVRAGEAAVEAARDKDVVVLLGSTGSGKTTSVVALAGREMVRRDDEQLGVVFEAREPLEGLEIGHSKESQTKHLAHHVRGEFVYIDTPGLEDTAGPAPELALAIGIQQLVRVSRSMRFVVVVNCASLQSERGGPMRSVAAFCSNLVGDKFGTHQDAFTFLFTHAVKFLPGAGRGGAAPFDAGAARRSLVRELEQVLKGAGEREVREVIACLLTALRAESGRCDVFDPVESDVEAVVRSIEQAACAIAEPEVHVQSALTLKAVLLLKNKLHAVHDAAALQLGGRAAFRLRAGAYDALAIECRAVRDLATATDRKFVRDAATRLDTLIAYEAAATAQALREIVARDLENGASPGHFCRGRRRLHALDGIVDEAGGGGGHGAVVDLDVSEALRALERSVEAELSKPRGPDCGVVLRAVLVLEAWAAAVGAGGGARGLITEYVCGIVAALAVAGAAADLAYVARGLEHVRRARDGGFCADNPALGRRVDASCKAAFRTLRRGVRGLEQAAAVAAAAAFAGKPGPLATTMGALKAVCAEGGGSARDTLVGPAYDAATAVTEMVFDAFEARVGVVQRLVEAPALNGALLEACIASLAAVADAMERGGPPSPDDCDGGDEAALAMRTVPRRFRVQQQRARAFLERRLTDDAARVDYCCQALEAHGIVGDAAGHAASLETLAACAWFDADRLAQLASFVDRYVTHCHGVVLEAFTAVADGLECCDAERVLASRDARTLAVEALFTGVYARLLRAASEVIARRWCRSEQATVEDAARLAASDDATSMMRSVDVVRMGATLGVAYVLRGLQLATAPRDRADDGHYADDGAVAAVTAVCLKRLDAQRDGAWALVEEKGRWPAKSALLDAARRWDGCGVSPPLPHFDELKRRFVQRLDERAARLEKLIQASADCDDAAIVDGIKGLRDVAALVDAPLDSAPSNHVAGLESLLEAKRAGIDSALERRCREDNFGEMAKYLVPFARSTDAAQLDKLGRYQKLLVARLNELVCSLRAQLESGAAVAEIMPKLRAARASGIGDLLAPAFDVDAAVGAIEADVDAQVSRDLAALEAALDAGEFPQVLRRFDAFRAFHDAARPLLEAGHVATYDSLAPQAASSLDDVRGLVKPFVEALSSHGDGDPEPRTYAAAASGSSGGYRGGYRARGGVAPSASRVLATTVATKAAALHRALETLRTAVDEPDVDGRIAACYRDVTTSLRTELNALNRQLLKRVESQHLYTHAIDVLTALETEWCQEGLDRHIQLDVDIQACLEDLRLRRSQRDDDVRVGLICATDEKVAATAAKLDSLSEKSSLFGIIRSSQRPADRREYYRLLNIAKGVVDNIVERAFVCFEDENFELLAESTNNLARIEAALGKHVGDHVCGALKCVNTPHLALVTKMQAGVVQALDGGAFERFESLFGTFCEVVLHCTAATAAACAGARRALHAAVERYVDAQLALLEEQLRVHAYADVRDSVLRWRHLALFMAIPFALYLSRARALDAEGASGGATGGAKGAAAALRDDAGLALLQRRYDYHFGDVLKVGRFYAVLGVRHDAPAEALEAAFRQTALKAHPDKHRGRGAAAERAATVACQALNEAHNELAKAGVRARFEERLERLSSNQRITRVLTGLRETLQRALVDGEYEPAASLLFRSGDLDVVAPLAWPVLDSNSLRAELFRLARAHVESIRVNVEHHWQARNFDALHDDFGRFDAAVRHLAQFEGVCTESWCAQVEDYIDVEIAGIASGALVMMRTLSEPEAFDQMHEFALLLVRVGRILDGLPRFKDIARLKLSQMLNACANNRWGFGYVYKLGLLLERGDVTELAGDDRVAKVIVAEMVHFKDILTMVWNEEVVQKPAAVAVGEIDAFRHVAGRPQQPLNVDRPRLLEQLELCEREYVTNLRTYLVPGADLDALVRGTTACARRATPPLPRLDAPSPRARARAPRPRLCLLHNPQVGRQLQPSLGAASGRRRRRRRRGRRQRRAAQAAQHPAPRGPPAARLRRRARSHRPRLARDADQNGRGQVHGPGRVRHGPRAAWLPRALRLLQRVLERARRRPLPARLRGVRRRGRRHLLED
ncbi:hypothetical protein M885DRAFT_103554 [Pelagophyceae sp. CCMP2097]|nr:hypothetical protein M885DRAFT_103554 [Pelagophyceae sp. CCMP2097]